MTRSCPDGGKCHHRCPDNRPCYRVENAGPLSGTRENDDWNKATEFASGDCDGCDVPSCWTCAPGGGW